MKDLIKNIKDDKTTTATGIVVIVLAIASALGFNVGEKLGIDNGTVIISVGAAISGLFNLISKRK